MTRALVTGATGFIGRHLVRALHAQGVETTCLVRASSNRAPLEPFAPRFVTGSVTDRASVDAAVEGADVVFHLAGVLRGFAADDFLATNEAGSRHVAEACAARSQAPTLVVVSSVAATGPSDGHTPRREDDPPRPVSLYGRSKLAGERATLATADRVPTTIVRPPIVFGEADRDFLKLFQPVVRGWHVVPGLVERRTSLVYVGDLVDALLAAWRRGERAKPDATGSGAYYVAFDHAPSFRELGQLLAEALDVGRVRTLAVPDACAWAVGGAGELWGRLRRRAGIVGLDKIREGTAGSWVVSPAKARRELGFAPPLTLALRLRQTAAWYRRERWL